MSHEERQGPPVPGKPIRLHLAPTSGARVSAVVAPMTGAEEMTLSERRDSGHQPAPVVLETLVLEIAVRALGERSPTPDGLNALLAGDRSRLVLATLAATYGAPETLLMRCPDGDCRALRELPFDAWVVLDAVSEGPAGEVIDVGGARLRLPNGSDLAAAARPGAARETLAHRCIVDADAGIDAAALLEGEITRRDPCAEILFTATCADCGGAIEALLDPLALLLSEVDRMGGVLVEIDRLARAYHWSEAELRSLPAHRRRRYLQTLDAVASEEWTS